jgi:hypothetical protein
MTKKQKQIIFNRVVEHARKQNKKAVIKYDDIRASCQYRTEKGEKCFIGALITDNAYSPRLEGAGLTHSALRGALSASLPGYKISQAELDIFFRPLQIIHDRREICEWEFEFKNFAERFNLTYTPPLT